MSGSAIGSLVEQLGLGPGRLRGCSSRLTPRRRRSRTGLTTGRRRRILASRSATSRDRARDRWRRAPATPGGRTRERVRPERLRRDLDGQLAAASGSRSCIVYRHFDSKEALYRAVLQRVFDRLAEESPYAGDTPRARASAPGSCCGRRRATRPASSCSGQPARPRAQFAEYASELRDHAVDASACRRLEPTCARRPDGRARPRRGDPASDAPSARGDVDRSTTSPVNDAVVRRRRGPRPRRAARGSSPPAARRSRPRAGRASARGSSSAAA